MGPERDHHEWQLEAAGRFAQDAAVPDVDPVEVADRHDGPGHLILHN